MDAQDALTVSIGIVLVCSPVIYGWIMSLKRIDPLSMPVMCPQCQIPVDLIFILTHRKYYVHRLGGAEYFCGVDYVVGEEAEGIGDS